MSEDIAMCEEEAAVVLEKLTDVSRRGHEASMCAGLC